MAGACGGVDVVAAGAAGEVEVDGAGEFLVDGAVIFLAAGAFRKEITGAAFFFFFLRSRKMTVSPSSSIAVSSAAKLLEVAVALVMVVVGAMAAEAAVAVTVLVAVFFMAESSLVRNWMCFSSWEFFSRSLEISCESSTLSLDEGGPSSDELSVSSRLFPGVVVRLDDVDVSDTIDVSDILPSVAAPWLSSDMLRGGGAVIRVVSCNKKRCVNEGNKMSRIMLCELR